VANSGVRVQDKFNQVYIDDETGLKFLYQIMQASALSFADDYLFNYIFNAESGINILGYANFNILTALSDDEASNISDSNEFNISYPIESSENVSDDYLPEIIFSAESPIPVISIISNIDIGMKIDDSADLFDEYIANFQSSITSILATSDDYLPYFDKNLVSDIVYMESYDVIKVP